MVSFPAGRLCYIIVSASGRTKDEAHELEGRVHSKWTPPLSPFITVSSNPFIPLFLFVHLPSFSSSVSLSLGGEALLTRNCQAWSHGILQGKTTILHNIRTQHNIRTKHCTCNYQMWMPLSSSTPIMPVTACVLCFWCNFVYIVSQYNTYTHFTAWGSIFYAAPNDFILTLNKK